MLRICSTVGPPSPPGKQVFVVFLRSSQVGTNHRATGRVANIECITQHKIATVKSSIQHRGRADGGRTGGLTNGNAGHFLESTARTAIDGLELALSGPHNHGP